MAHNKKLADAGKKPEEFVALNVNHIVLYAFLNLVLIYIAIRKVMFFMTIWKSFGTMIRLVEKSLWAIKEFLIYFLMMILVMSGLTKVLGYDIGAADAKGTFQSSAGELWNYFKHTFLNSVGGIEEPTVDFWTKESPWEKAEMKLKYKAAGTVSNYAGNEQAARVMQVVIWLSWFVTVFLLFIVLCNFMISYISQTYEDVLEMQTEDTYETRCRLNYEFYVMLKFYWQKVVYKDPAEYNFNCFLLTADFDRID